VVELTIYRKSADKKIKIKKKGVIPIKSVDVAVLLNDSTGYIKSIVLPKTFEEFKNGLVKLKGAKVLVIDLRDNGAAIWKRQLLLLMN
jgi:carboxyl-terminal processing protease